ncbi:MAG: phosphatidylglycerol lysyltransferase domain-containing protein [Candidatus Altiarchaeia archaeon]
MIGIKDYKQVSMGDRPLFQEYFNRFPQTHTEYLYTGLVCWSHYTPAFYTVRDGSLLIMNMLEGKPQFRPPVGERNDVILGEVLDLAKREGGKKAVIAIDESAKEWINASHPKINVQADRDFFDYVYLAKSLAELRGKPYENQRNHLNKFHRKYAYSVERIDQQNRDEVAEFLQRWCLARDCEEDRMLEEEKKAILFCMDRFFELELSGIVIRIDGKIQALSVWEQITKETAAIHYEKGMQEYDGIYPAINNEAAKILAKDYKYINRESDLGIPGLRTAKERLHPDHMETLYYIDRDSL